MFSSRVRCGVGGRHHPIIISGRYGQVSRRRGQLVGRVGIIIRDATEDGPAGRVPPLARFGLESSSAALCTLAVLVVERDKGDAVKIADVLAGMDGR